jgi:PAS domain S-box-containing protein
MAVEPTIPPDALGAGTLAPRRGWLARHLRRQWADPVDSVCWVVFCIALPLVLAVLMPPGSGLAAIVDVGPLHNVGETAAIVVAMLVFGVTWNAYSNERSGNLVILACALFSAALVDLADMLVLDDVWNRPLSAPGPQVDFTLPSNIVAAVGLLIVSLRRPRPLHSPLARYWILAASLLIVIPVYGVVFLSGPAAQLALSSGVEMMRLERQAEAAIALALLLPAARFYLDARRLRSEEAAGMFGATCMFLLAQIGFALYSQADDGFNLMGHAYKVAAYGFIYRAVFIVSVKEPFDRLRAAERHNRLTNELLERMFESIHVLVAYLDREMSFVRVNSAYAAADGRPPEFFVGKKHFELYPHPENEMIFRRVVETGQPYSVYAKPFSYPEHPERGTSYWDWHIEPVKDVDGRVQAIVLSLLDVTQRVRHEEILGASLEDSIQAIAATVESRDPYTAGHQRRVATLAVAIARELGMAEGRIRGLHLAATIHDLGKIHIPAEILTKPGRLTAIEFEMMKLHPQAGYDIVKDIKFPWPIAQIILQHHERADGTGYPKGLKGDAILLEARILAVADVAESMMSHRPYRAALGLDAAVAEVTRGRGTAFDPPVVDAFVRLIRDARFSFDAQQRR